MKKFISFILIVSIILTLAAPAVSANGTNFSDLMVNGKKHWAYDTIMKLANAKVIGGFPDGTYKPEASVTREQFVKLLVEALQLEKTNRKSFDDIEGSWAKQYIETAVKEGIIIPSEVGTSFRPTEAINRKEVAYMVARGLKIKPYKVWQPYDFPYSDTSDQTVAKLYSEYLLNGTVRNGIRYFDMDRNMTRAEAAVIIDRVMQYKKDKTAYKTLKRNELINSTNFIKAAKDADFEKFMSSEEARKYVSVDYIKVEDGVVTVREFGSWDYGDLIIENPGFKSMNKALYNTIKGMVASARKYNNYVRVLYNPNAEKITVDYYENRTQGESSSQPANIEVMFCISPTKYENTKNMSNVLWQANILWNTEDEILTSLEDLAKINYTQTAFLEPLKAAFIAVYGDIDGTALNNYLVNEYRLEYSNPNKRARINTSVITINGIEVKNLNDETFKPSFVTNTKK